MIRASRGNPCFELVANFFHGRRIFHRLVKLDLHELANVALRAFDAHLSPVKPTLCLLFLCSLFQWIVSLLPL
jgi:hypothetical protein